MKLIQTLPLFLSLVFASLVGRAASVLQPADGSAIAFEADIGIAQIINNTTKVYWVSTNDSTASGGTTLYCATTNSLSAAQAGRPNSFVTYSVKFAQAGTYYIYYRWRADAAVVTASGDNFQGNSCFFGSTFGTFTTAGDSSQMYRLAANNVGAPGATSYQWNSGGSDAGFTPPYGYTVAAPGVQILSIGDREWGFMLDRIVISQDPTLTGAQLDLIPNALTDAIPQDPNASFIAFEADRPEGAGAHYINDLTREYWVSTNDITASGGTSLYCASTAGSVAAAQLGRPNSFVTYTVNFAQPGTYYIYYRWRADQNVVAFSGDNFQGNSCFFGNTFGTFTTVSDSSQMYRLASNGVGAPGATSYQWNSGGADSGFTAPYGYIVNAAGPQVLSIGDREWGFYLDRIVISTDSTLTGAQLDLLANSGGLASPPRLKVANGAWGNTSVAITFGEAVVPGTVQPTNFTISGAVTVTGAAVNPGNQSVVRLTTSPQAQGSNYTITVNNVVSALTGLAVSPNSTINFTSWRLATGWALEEVYFGTGSSALDITNVAAYSNNAPNRVYWVKGLQNDHFPDGNGISTRLTTLFTPTSTGTYSVYAVADDDAFLFYSANTSAAVFNSYDTVPDLVPLVGIGSSVPAGHATGPVPPFYNGGNLPAHTGTLTAGTPYVIQALHRQVVSDSYVKVGVQADSSPTPPEQLPVLDGSQISAWVNPDLGAVTFTQQPTNTTAAAGSRATFRVKVTANEGPVFYQWRSNGVDIAGAVRPSYITPVLNSSFNGTVYSCRVGVAGRDTLSANATLTVSGSVVASLQPYIGINFSGGKFDTTPTSLSPQDVAGAIRQENWNNLFDSNFDGSDILNDAGGNPTTVSMAAAGFSTYVTGTKSIGDADSLLFQGYVDGQSNIVSFVFSGLPAGVYSVLAYSVGFSFNATYEEAFDLNTSAGTTFPTYHVRAQTGTEYQANPRFVRMSSTNANARDSGNYVQFDDVLVNAGDSVTVMVSPESLLAQEIPAISALQVVQSLPTLNISISGSTVTVHWPLSAFGYVLESSPSVGPSANWTVVAGTPNPIAAAGTTTTSAVGTKFYRLHKQ